MARFLFATQPITGHVLPALPLVRALVGRGHEVWWYVGKKFRDRVEAAGARFVPYTHAYDYDDSDYDAAFPGRGQLKGLGQIKFDFINLFVKQISPQHLDLEETLRAFPADVVVGDPSVFAAVTVSERGGPPAATYSITYLGVQSRDTAPAGLGLLPNSSLLGQVRNRLLYFLAANVVFKAVSDEIARQCEIVGVRKRGFEGPVVSPFLVLQPTVPSFEYPRRDLPRQIHYIGALLPDAPASFTPPTWWDEVTNKRRPVVVVTQGTVATDPRELITPTIEALADEDVLVIAAGVKSVEALGLSRLPDNARVEAFVPFGKLLPLADVYVTNGGFGGVHYALSNGVAVVAAGTTEDKPEIGNRVAYSGVGINLKTNRPSAEQIRSAVLALLQNESYRRRARELQAELAHHDAPVEAAMLLEELARTRKPVLRDEYTPRAAPSTPPLVDLPSV